MKVLASSREPVAREASRPRTGVSAFRITGRWEAPAAPTGPTSPVDRALGPGSVIAGRYRLFERLARGGMGWVWSAIDEGLQREVAVKLMSPELADDDDYRARFLDEARVAAALSSPHVVTVFDGGIADGVPFLVLERLHGEDLHRRLQRAGRLSIAATSRLIVDAARGLAAAHAGGVVHRDIKPPNLFITHRQADHEEMVKILDFGVANRPGAVLRRTRSEAILGSPHFMSPEQVRGASRVGPASDLFSLAAVAYRCVTGRLPFDGDTSEVLVQIDRGVFAPPSSLVPGLPPGIDAFFDRAFALEPERRHPSALVMAQALRAIVDREAERRRRARRFAGARAAMRGD